MATGFLTDTTVCIGCKACEVACKQWNQLPADGYELTGDSYDNTKQLSATWRHVAFIENPKKRRLTGDVDLVALAEDVTEPLPAGRARRPGTLGFYERRVQALRRGAVPQAARRPSSATSSTTSTSTRHLQRLRLLRPRLSLRRHNPGPRRPRFKCTLCYDLPARRPRTGLRQGLLFNSIMFGEVEERRPSPRSGYRSSTTRATARPTSGARLRWGDRRYRGQPRIHPHGRARDLQPSPSSLPTEKVKKDHASMVAGAVLGVVALAFRTRGDR